jgi:hypothetical protein
VVLGERGGVESKSSVNLIPERPLAVIFVSSLPYKTSPSPKPGESEPEHNNPEITVVALLTGLAIKHKTVLSIKLDKWVIKGY